MNATSVNAPFVLKSSAGWSVALSALMILAGVLGIILPPVAGLVATVFFGWLFIFSGAAHFVFAWHTRATGALIWELLVGTVYVVLGGYLLVNPVVGLVSLTFALAVYLFAEAVLEFAMGFGLRRLPGSGWLFFDGVVTLVLAILIWRTWPSNSIWVVGTLLGVSMLFSGVARLMISLARHRLAKGTA